MKYFKCIQLFFLLIGLNCFSQKKNWIKYSADSIISAKHFWNDRTEQLDSLTFNFLKKTFNFPNLKNYIKKDNLLTAYKDSLSMPFDFILPTINTIIDYNKSTIIVLGNNRGIEKEFSNYLHIILIDKKTFKINCWLTTHTTRGTYKASFFINEKKRQIVLLKKKNFLEEKIYLLDYKKEKYKEVYISKEGKYIGSNPLHIETYLPTFTICY